MMHNIKALVLSGLALFHYTAASPTGPAPNKTINKRAVTPVLSAASQVAAAQDPYWNRDSCTSTKVDGREFWTCRDSIGKGGQFYSSTASWTDFSNGKPDYSNGQLLMYGTNNAEYFSVQSNECGPHAGICSDNTTRYAIWPDSRPLPVAGANNAVKMYTWVRKRYLNKKTLSDITSEPATSLYRSNYNPAVQTGNLTLPPVTLVSEAFWPAMHIPYGSYGWVIPPAGKMVYLYGQLNNGNSTIGAALARVPIGSIEDKSQYMYYNNGGWSSTAPAIDDASAKIANAGTDGGQGTFYHSTYFDSYVWIGADHYNLGSGFYVATAPMPEGPWTTPALFYNGTNGNNATFSSYSQQAHPGLTANNGNGNDIYLTFTQNNMNSTGGTNSVTPLIHAVWQ